MPDATSEVSQKQRWTNAILIAAILLFAAAVRLIGISKHSLWYDECASLQIVQAPSAIWQMTSATQRIESLLSAEECGASREMRRANAITPIAMSTATNRCAICSQIWNASTSDKPRASRQALILASAAVLVSGIHAPFAVGKSRIDKSRC